MSVDTNTLAIELEQLALLLELGRALTIEVEAPAGEGESLCEKGCCCVDGLL